MLVILVENELGVLVCVIGLFFGCGYNIDSLIVVEVDYLGYCLCIIIVMCGMFVVIE